MCLSQMGAVLCFIFFQVTVGGGNQAWWIVTLILRFLPEIGTNYSSTYYTEQSKSHNHTSLEVSGKWNQSQKERSWKDLVNSTNDKQMEGILLVISTILWFWLSSGLQVAIASAHPSWFSFHLSALCSAPEADFYATHLLGSLALWFLIGFDHCKSLATVWRVKRRKMLRYLFYGSFLAGLHLLEAEFFKVKGPNQTGLFFFLFFIFIFLICGGFCHTLKWNSHGFTCVPHPNPPSHLPLHPLGFPSAPGPSACLMHPTWAGDLFHPR